MSEDGLSISQTSENVNNPLYQLPAAAYKNGKANVNSEAFKRWFGDSKVVDENGQPLVVYHGTAVRGFKAFSEFKPLSWFSVDKEYAKVYSKTRKKKFYERGKIYPVYLSIKNPFMVDDIDNAFDSFYTKEDYYTKLSEKLNISLDQLKKELEPIRATREYFMVNSPEFKNLLQSLGYDGIQATEYGKTTYAAFNPNQIKSVNNRGTFDPSNDNIYYQSQISDEQFEADLAEFDKILDSFHNENEGYYNKKSKFDAARRIQKKYQDFFMYNIADASNHNGWHDPFYFEYDGQKDFTNMWLPKKLEKGSSVILYRNAEQVSIPVTEFDENKFKQLGYKRQKKFDEGMRDVYTLNKDEKSDSVFYQSAFAGSRIDYDRPSLEAIGTGEGNQVHGWGLYYALNKDVAEGYRYKFITEDVGLTGDVITEIDKFGKERTKKIYKDKLNSYKNELDKFNKEHTSNGKSFRKHR